MDEQNAHKETHKQLATSLDHIARLQEQNKELQAAVQYTSAQSAAIIDNREEIRAESIKFQEENARLKVEIDGLKQANQELAKDASDIEDRYNALLAETSGARTSELAETAEHLRQTVNRIVKYLKDRANGVTGKKPIPLPTSSNAVKEILIEAGFWNEMSEVQDTACGG